MATHQAAGLAVSGAGNMTLQQQVDTIRLNPGIVGDFTDEARAKAAEDDANGVPLPEFTEHQTGSVEGLQAQSNADASVTGTQATPAEAATNAAASTGDVEAQNQAAAASEAPPSVERTVTRCSATVKNAPEGGGYLVKFDDKPEEHFYATGEELTEALNGYDHNPVDAQ